MEKVAQKDETLAAMAEPLKLEIAAGIKAPRAAARHLIDKLL